MKQIRPLFFGLWLAVLATALPALRAQENPPAPAAPEKPAVEQVVPAAPENSPAPAVEQQAAPAAAVETPAVAAKAAQAEVEAAAAPEDDATMRELAPAPGEESATPVVKPKKKRSNSHGGDTPPHFGNQTIPAGTKAAGAVSITGNTVVDGELTGEAVSILGSTTVNGVAREAVSVLGSTIVNGHVKGEVVAVLGDVILGPEAVVDGEIVAVLGAVNRAPGAKVGGAVQQVGGSIVSFGDFKGLRAYLSECLLWGRPLAFHEDVSWAWGVAGVFLLFYLLLALIFPRGIDRCADALQDNPGGSVLAAFLTALLTPILIVLLAITGVGIVLIPFVGAALFFGTLFGKAAVLAWFGRRVTGLFGEGVMRHAVFAVLFGGIVVTLLYTVPFLGFLLWKLFGILGLGMVVFVLIRSLRSEKVSPPQPQPQPASAFVAPVVPTPQAAGFAVPPAPAAAQSAGFGGAVPPVAPPLDPGSTMPSFAASMPSAATAAAAAVPSPAMTLPRAGFWIRAVAGFLDVLMITITLGITGLMEQGPGLMFVAVATYCAVMWKFKGTTIGGVIFGLKVVRLDDRPIDWGVAIVRALTGFVSFFPAGLGFIWVAFDDEKQSWHDKIAGTTIVRMPKGTSLI